MVQLLKGQPQKNMRIQAQSLEPTEKGLGEVVCTLNSKAWEVESGGSLGFACQPLGSVKGCVVKSKVKRETEVGTWRQLLSSSSTL